MEVDNPDGGAVAQGAACGETLSKKLVAKFADDFLLATGFKSSYNIIN